MGYIETVLLRVLGPIHSWVNARRERRTTPLVVKVREARTEGKVIKREINLAQDDEASRQRICGAVIKWYGGFELELAREAPVVFNEFRSPGIPSGYVTEAGETVRTPITLDILRDVVNDDLRRLRGIERRLIGPVWQVRLQRRWRSVRRRVRK